MKTYHLMVRRDDGELIHVDTYGVIAAKYDDRSQAEVMDALAERLKRAAIVLRKQATIRQGDLK